MGFLRTTVMTVYRARMYPNKWDMLALVFVFAIIAFFAWTARQMVTPYQLGQIIPISLDSHMLPFYAARTVVRMLIALVISLLFTFTFGTWAAKSVRAERIIIPMIDILQSVPILGFLSVTVAGFIGLFPGSMIGPECAAIFAIFTSQAWNMAFGFYQTVRAVPAEIGEAANMLHLSSWQRFWRIEVPFSMPSLLWNTMASMSAGWFFVVAAEAITVSNQDILLPGIGSYIFVAIQAADLKAIGEAVLTMFLVILIYDQLLFRPLVAWSDKFKSEYNLDEKSADSWVIDLFRRTRMMRTIGHNIARGFDAFVNVSILRRAKPVRLLVQNDRKNERIIAFIWGVAMIVLAITAFLFLGNYLLNNISVAEVVHVFFLGLVTACRVLILIIVASFIWVPVGVWIGLRPRVAQLAQPIAQILAAFPANLLYPFIVMFIVTYDLSPNVWLTPLMILGAQWYILFNVIAGASVLSKDLIQATDNLGVSGWLRWRCLLLPAIFPYYVTGAITAAGGAWNASIVAEVASWGDHKLVATGLGAYIAQYTTLGSFSHIVLGIGMMCLLVLFFNRLVWRPLYDYAETRYLME